MEFLNTCTVTLSVVSEIENADDFIVRYGVFLISKETWKKSLGK
jgi:hypothetical protein